MCSGLWHKLGRPRALGPDLSHRARSRPNRAWPRCGLRVLTRLVWFGRGLAPRRIWALVLAQGVLSPASGLAPLRAACPRKAGLAPAWVLVPLPVRALVLAQGMLSPKPGLALLRAACSHKAGLVRRGSGSFACSDSGSCIGRAFARTGLGPGAGCVFSQGWSAPGEGFSPRLIWPLTLAQGALSPKPGLAPVRAACPRKAGLAPAGVWVPLPVRTLASFTGYALAQTGLGPVASCMSSQGWSGSAGVLAPTPVRALASFTGHALAQTGLGPVAGCMSLQGCMASAGV